MNLKNLNGTYYICLFLSPRGRIRIAVYISFWSLYFFVNPILCAFLIPPQATTEGQKCSDVRSRSQEFDHQCREAMPARRTSAQFSVHSLRPPCGSNIPSEVRGQSSALKELPVSLFIFFSNTSLVKNSKYSIVLTVSVQKKTGSGTWMTRFRIRYP